MSHPHRGSSDGPAHPSSEIQNFIHNYSLKKSRRLRSDLIYFRRLQQHTVDMFAQSIPQQRNRIPGEISNLVSSTAFCSGRIESVKVLRSTICLWQCTGGVQILVVKTCRVDRYHLSEKYVIRMDYPSEARLSHRDGRACKNRNDFNR